MYKKMSKVCKITLTKISYNADQTKYFIEFKSIGSVTRVL